MKLSICVLLIGLCLAAHANAATHVEVEPYEMEFIAQDVASELEDIETYGAFGPMYFVLKAALRSLKGVNCSIKGVMNMRTAAQTFIDDVKTCGVVVSKQLQALINQCLAIISTANDVITLNDTSCNNADYDPSTDANKKTPWKCFWNMLGKMITMKKQISKAIGMAKKVPQVPGNTGVCLNTALNNMTTVFTTFPTFVKTCSKLTS